MARVDYQGAYTRCPAKPSPAYPNRSETWVPFVEIALWAPSGLRRFKTRAMLDTGASLTLFHSDFADAIGIDWRTAPTTPVIGISGAHFEAHVVPVKIELCDAHYMWTADIAFSDVLNRGMPLLGHDGFFEHFEVRFKTSNRYFRIHLK